MTLLNWLQRGYILSTAPSLSGLDLPNILSSLSDHLVWLVREERKIIKLMERNKTLTDSFLGKRTMQKKEKMLSYKNPKPKGYKKDISKNMRTIEYCEITGKEVLAEYGLHLHNNDVKKDLSDVKKFMKTTV